MLLVLAILVAITAVTLPVVGRMYDTHRIQQAAMEVRTTLSAARLRAVDGGEAFECRFEPDGRHLVILARRDRGIRFGSEEVSSSSANRRLAEGIHVELPEPLYFLDGGQLSRRDSKPTPLRRPRRSRCRSSAEAGPRQSIFAPSGSSSDAEFEIRDQQGRAVELQVRGLTGAASASALVRRSAE